MRIIGGSLQGRTLNPKMNSWPTRPTTDISKEALFNILMNLLDFDQVKMLDLFGGTGAHSLEFLSRGCLDVTYVDKYPGCIKWISGVKNEFYFKNELSIVRSDVKKFIISCCESYDYIFAGPPYPLPWLREIPELIFENGLMKNGALLVIEHNKEHDFGHLSRFTEKRNYGQTHFSFFKS